MLLRLPLILLLLVLSLPFIQTDAREVVTLQLFDAGPQGLPVLVEADIDGPAAIIIPQWAWRFQVGSLTPERAEGNITRQGNRLGGQLKATILRGSGVGNSPESHSVNVQIQAIISANGLVEGTWRNGSRNGFLAGFVRPLPLLAEHNRIVVHLDCPYPHSNQARVNMPGSWQANAHRMVITADLYQGQLVNPEVYHGGSSLSWYPTNDRSIWVLDNRGNPAVAVTGNRDPSLTTEGRIDAEGKLHLRISGTSNEIATVWTVELQRSGGLYHGKWQWEAEGIPSAQGRAAARLGQSQKQWQATPATGDRRARLLAHVRALYQHPALTPFRDPVLLGSSARPTGDKQYDNLPYNVAGGIYTGLLLARLSDDPLEQAQGLTMARTAASVYQQLRHGSLQLPVTYKGMSWMHALSGESLAALAEFDAQSKQWNELANQFSRSIIRKQLDNGGWTWFEHNGSGLGVSNFRNNRSVDNRALPFGDVLYALQKVRALPNGEDSTDAEQAHHQFLRELFLNPPDWFWMERSPEDNLSATSMVGWLAWLVEGNHANHQAIDAVQAKILEIYGDQLGNRPILQGGYPRYAGNRFSGPDLAMSARFARILAQRGQHREALERIDALLASAQPASGLIDHAGRQLPADMMQISQVDAHPYTGLRALIGWEIFQALEILEDSP